MNLNRLPIPKPEEREYYFLNDDISYVSVSSEQVRAVIPFLKSPKTLLDFGSSSGRMARHFHYEHKIQVTCCDTNVNHINWINTYLPELHTFHTNPEPPLPFEDNQFDSTVSFSVFSHIASKDKEWIEELKRVTKNVLLITCHTQYAWDNILEHHMLDYVKDHPDFDPNVKLKDRLIFSSSEHHYHKHVFTHTDYINSVWGKPTKLFPQWVTRQDVLIYELS